MRVPGARAWLSTAAVLASAAVVPPTMAAAAADTCGGPTNLHECSEDPPSASITFAPAEPKRRDEVTFTGHAGANPDRKIESTRWDLYDDGEFTDGDTLTAKRTFHVPGTYTVRLRVEDDHGAVTTASATVAVGDAPAAEPVRPRSSLAFQANAFRDGYIPAGAARPPLARQWSRRLGDRVSYALVAGRRVFVSATTEHTRSARVYGLDRRSGAVLWMRIVGAHLGAAPVQLTYDGGRLFALGSGGTLLALAPASGRTLWATQQPQDSAAAAPLAYGGIVWTGGSGTGGTTYAFRASDGAFLWQQQLFSSAGPPAIDANGLYVAQPCDGIYGMDRLTGFGFWWHHGDCSGGGDAAVPVVHDGKVWGLAEDRRRNWVVRAADGTLAETFEADAPPAFSGDTGLFLRHGVLTARNVRTHARLWRFAGDRRLATPPLVVGAYAYVASSAGRVYSLRVQDGRRSWSGRAVRAPGGVAPVGLAAGGGTLVVPAAGRVVAYASRRPRARRARDRRAPASLAGVRRPRGGGRSVTQQVNPRHDGFLNAASPAPPLRRAWSHFRDGDAGTPIVAGGRVFDIDKGKGFVRAYRLRGGKQLWARRLPARDGYSGAGGGAYDDGKLFVSGNGLSALDAATGRPLWHSQLAAGAPVADGGLVYFSGEGAVAALRESDGSLAWRHPVLGSYDSVPALDAVRAYASFACLNASAVRRDTGDAAWAIHPLGCTGGGGATPALHSGRLYMREGDALFVLDPGSGRLLDVLASKAAPAFAGDVGVFLDGEVLEAVDLRSGGLVWTFRPRNYAIRTPPLIVGRTVYTATEDGTLYALRLTTGRVAWRTRMGHGYLPESSTSTDENRGLAAGGGRLVVPTGGGLIAFESLTSRRARRR